jgi:hypothetical protein
MVCEIEDSHKKQMRFRHVTFMANKGTSWQVYILDAAGKPGQDCCHCRRLLRQAQARVHSHATAHFVIIINVRRPCHGKKLEQKVLPHTRLVAVSRRPSTAADQTSPNLSHKWARGHAAQQVISVTRLPAEDFRGRARLSARSGSLDCGIRELKHV